jgi:hypothetical protein
MASDTGITGKNAYIAFGGTVLSSNYRTLSTEDSIGTVDQSAGSDAGITMLTTLRDGSFSLELKRPTGGTTNWITLVPGQEGTLEVGPEGTATNSPKMTVNVILTSRSTPVTYNDIVIDTLNFAHDDSTGVVWTSY